jgi:3-methyladenine DNA glycosylase Mpg
MPNRKSDFVDLQLNALSRWDNEGGAGPLEVSVGPRIGIKHCADWPLRFFLSGNRFLSR